MTKLAYPSKGVYPQCEKNFLSYHEDLSEAAKLCNFDDSNVPNDFPAKQYLTSLKGYLIKVGFACVDVMREVKGADVAFQALSDEAAMSAARITVSKVTQNDRLVTANSAAGANSSYGQSGGAAGGAAGGVAGAIAGSAAGTGKAKANKKKKLVGKSQKNTLGVKIAKTMNATATARNISNSMNSNILSGGINGTLRTPLKVSGLADTEALSTKQNKLPQMDDEALSTNQSKLPSTDDEALSTNQDESPTTEQTPPITTGGAVNSGQATEATEEISENNNKTSSVNNAAPGNISTAPINAATNKASSGGTLADNDEAIRNEETPINFNGTPTIGQASSMSTDETAPNGQRVSSVDEIINDEDLLLPFDDGTSESNA